MKTKFRNLLAIYWKSRIGKLYHKEWREWNKVQTLTDHWMDSILLAEWKLECRPTEYLSIVSQSGQVIRSIRRLIAFAELRSLYTWRIAAALAFGFGLALGISL